MTGYLLSTLREIPEAEKGADGIYRLYVSQTAQGLANGRSWRNALGDIQQALDYFGNDANFEHDPNKDTRRCEIWVSKGTYNPKTSVKEDNWGTSFILNRYSSIYGGFRGSNLPYYESWIESFKVEPSKRVDATGVWKQRRLFLYIGRQWRDYLLSRGKGIGGRTLFVVLTFHDR